MVPTSSGRKEKYGRSLNHLLNFSFAERPKAGPDPYLRRPKKYQPYSKEKYVNANFRFIVKSGETYQGNLFDTDISVEWDHIEQVVGFFFFFFSITFSLFHFFFFSLFHFHLCFGYLIKKK